MIDVIHCTGKERLNPTSSPGDNLWALADQLLCKELINLMGEGRGEGALVTVVPYKVQHNVSLITFEHNGDHSRL